jgi:hypothetical protein
MVIVHSGLLGIPTAASCTVCGAWWQAPAIGSIHDDYEQFCHDHRHWDDETVADWPQYPDDEAGPPLT